MFLLVIFELYHIGPLNLQPQPLQCVLLGLVVIGARYYHQHICHPLMHYEFGFQFQDAHTALGDVRAMAKVLPEMLEIGKTIKFPSELKSSPSFNAVGKILPRKSNA